MDTFKEQLIKKIPETNDLIKKILIIAASCLLAVLCFLLFMGTPFSVIGVVIAGGIIYGGYYLVTSLIVEYEYILTNGDLDVDKIIAQRSRKRLITFNLTLAHEFGKADESFRALPNETIIKATANDPSQADYYIRLNHTKLGNSVLLFTPNEEMLELVKNCLPRNMRGGR